MKAYVLNRIGCLDLMDVPEPMLKDGEVLVEVKAAGICGSDIPRIFANGTYHFPTIPGHEFAGVVCKVKDKENEGLIGKRVGVFPLIPCRTCAPCQKRQYEMCMHYDYLGSRSDGGFAEYVAVPVRNLIEIPDGISMEAAAMLEPASVGIHALRRVYEEGMNSAVIFGPGTIGLLIAQWLRALGIEKIILVGTGEGQKKLAGELGFSEFYNGKEVDVVQAILERTAGEGVDLAIECAGYSEVLEECLDVVKRGGKVLTVGNPHGDMNLKRDIYWKILRKQLQLCGTWNSSFIPEEKEDDWTRTIAAMEQGILSPEKQITHRLSFEELHRGLEIMRDKSEYYNKVMIVR